MTKEAGINALEDQIREKCLVREAIWIAIERRQTWPGTGNKHDRELVENMQQRQAIVGRALFDHVKPDTAEVDKKIIQRAKAVNGTLRTVSEIPADIELLLDLLTRLDAEIASLIYRQHAAERKLQVNRSAAAHHAMAERP